MFNNIYTIEDLERIGDMLDDFQEWQDFEEDYKTNPWG